MRPGLPAACEAPLSELKAIVIFHGDASGPIVNLFCSHRPYNHCWVAVNDGNAWIGLDPYCEATVIRGLAPASYDLARHYRDKGRVVIETETREDGNCGIPLPITCVEQVKRVLGIRCWAFTPWQLYKYLRKSEHASV